MASAIHVGDPATANQFFRGVYPQDAPTWRWAGPKFSVTLGTPPGAAAKGARLVLEFNLPEPSINALKQITLAAKIGGVTLPPESFTAAGRHEYRQEVPGAALASDVVSPEFTVDKYLQLPNDPRQLALIISAVRLESL